MEKWAVSDPGALQLHVILGPESMDMCRRVDGGSPVQTMSTEHFFQEACNARAACWKFAQVGRLDAVRIREWSLPVPSNLEKNSTALHHGGALTSSDKSLSSVPNLRSRPTGVDPGETTEQWRNFYSL